MAAPDHPDPEVAFRDGYIDLLKRLVRREGFSESMQPIGEGNTGSSHFARRVQRAVRVPFRWAGLDLVRARAEKDSSLRDNGMDWPSEAETMIGRKRLDNLEMCLRSVVEEEVPGDFIECGVWRGGASIFARGVLDAYGEFDRKVWLADSFRGLPKPAPGTPDDEEGKGWHLYSELAVSLDQVEWNFSKYGLLSDRVEFLEGWFSDTLPDAPVGRLAVLRADGDMYSSTVDILENLYDKLSPGGYVIIDDYIIDACRKAVEDFRAARGIDEPIEEIDPFSAFWRRAL
jgi:hypothetical protein